KIDGNKMIGPGVIDCKGGIAVALLVMKSLKTLGHEKHLRLMLTSDEEVSNCLGGEKEIDFIVNTAAGFKGAFNCEVGRDGEVVVSRKGILRVRIHITGKPSHSGIDYFAGVSAVREAAYKLIELETQSKEGATTYNCGIIQGGDIINIVPAKCTMSVDVRVNSVEDMDAAYEVIKKVTEKSFVEGSKAELEIISKRLPMMRTKETDELFEKLREVSLANGLGDLIPIESGGGSDSAYTQLAGVPSVCAVGACGDYCHTVNEYAEIDSLVKRAKLLAATTIWH
ncbi:MAG: M20/M25/M40 family metallo-hydrolase, partial [Tyzzerella sp.]|nr:M20/M25/M40 family metallo-hydrolase [Tyzzerella sp.]